MFLTVRPPTPADLPEGFRILFDRFLFEAPESRKDLFAFYRKAISDRWGIIPVVEDRNRPQGRRIVGFGMSLFVNDEFAREMRTDLPPFFALQILRRWKQGKNVVLSRPEIARANAGDGVNQFTFNYGLERQKDFAEELQIRGKILEYFTFLCLGHRMKQMLHEAYSAEETENVLRGGLALYREPTEPPGKKEGQTSRKTFLLGLERSEGSSKVSVAVPFFTSAPPRFGFTQGEQDVLERALMGGLDREMACAMGLTVWAVKKRWQSVYEKVEKLDPALLEPGLGKSDEEFQKVRRRLLLDYLRSHLEELRPYDPHHRKKTSHKKQKI